MSEIKHLSRQYVSMLYNSFHLSLDVADKCFSPGKYFQPSLIFILGQENISRDCSTRLGFGITHKM